MKNVVRDFSGRHKKIIAKRVTVVAPDFMTTVAKGKCHIFFFDSLDSSQVEMFDFLVPLAKFVHNVHFSKITRTHRILSGEERGIREALDIYGKIDILDRYEWK